MFSFKSAVALLSLAVTTAVAAPAAPAQAETISCPHSQIRKEVTTALPSGWWNTPVVNSLTEAKVVTIGGRRTLQCLYGAAGSIQRYAPEGANCRVNGRRFECTRASAGAATFSTGPLDIPQTWLADLDRGRVVNNNTADIWFQAQTADLLYLSPRNGAKLGVGNRRNRGYDGCRTARFTSDRVSLRDVPVGSYVCVKTNEGRVSQFRVNAVSGGSPKTLRLGYTTWQ